MAARLEHEIFSRHVNTNFQISLGETDIFPAELDSVGELQLSPRQERFSIMFRGPKEPVISQGLYQFKHDEMGEFSLFIVPLRQDDEGTYYEACFNRVRKTDE